MAIYKTQLLNALKPHLNERGFRKKGATWHRQTDHLIQVFNVQTSTWSEFYWFNVGIYSCALGDLDRPPENLCHIRDRIPGNPFTSDLVERIKTLDDFADVTAKADDQIADLTEVIALGIDKWFGCFGTMEDIRRQFDCSVRLNLLIHKDVWGLLGIRQPD